VPEVEGASPVGELDAARATILTAGYSERQLCSSARWSLVACCVAGP